MLEAVLAEGGESRHMLQMLQQALASDPEAQSSIDRLTAILDLVEAAGVSEFCHLDPSIARGLSYYTGLVYETYLDALPGFGSVMSGGRYDGLVGMFAGKDLPAIGISLGISRLFAAMKEMDLLEQRSQPAEVLVVLFSTELAAASFEVASKLRGAGIATVVYPQEAKLKKQLQFAQRAGIPYVIVIGEEEHRQGVMAKPARVIPCRNRRVFDWLRSTRSGSSSIRSSTLIPAAVMAGASVLEKRYGRDRCRSSAIISLRPVVNPPLAPPSALPRVLVMMSTRS